MRLTLVAATFALTLPALAQNLPTAFPATGAMQLQTLLDDYREPHPTAFPTTGAMQLLDNERVTVWEFNATKARTTMITRRPLDMIAIELANATVKPAATAKTVSFKTGQVSFKKKGAAAGDQPTQLTLADIFLVEGVGDTPRRTIFIDLKDAPVQPIKNTSGRPEAFPREGAKKLLENDRVTVWDYTWQMGKPTPMHFHTLDTVTVAFEVGEVKSTSLDGESTVNSNAFGKVRFNPRGRIHTEELVKGAAHAIIVELKQ